MRKRCLIVFKNINLTDFKFWHYHMLTAWPCAKNLTSLNPCFVIYKIKLIIVSIWKGVYEDYEKMQVKCLLSGWHILSAQQLVAIVMIMLIIASTDQNICTSLDISTSKKSCVISTFFTAPYIIIYSQISNLKFYSITNYYFLYMYVYSQCILSQPCFV